MKGGLASKKSRVGGASWSPSARKQGHVRKGWGIAQGALFGGYWGEEAFANKNLSFD